MDILQAFINSVPSSIEQGLIYGILALGIYITYSILDFPDLSVDGTFPLGGVVSTAMLLRGINPIICLLGAMLAGALAGLATGLINVKLKVRDLFSGVIVMTGLYSINLRISDGNSLLTIPRNAVTLFRNNALADFLPAGTSSLIISLVIALFIKLLLDAFFSTRFGLLLRATGDNEQVVTSLARDKGNVKIWGLVIANSLVALSGGILCQQQRLFEASMGTGTLVLGLASVIIGTTLFRSANRDYSTLAVLIGAIIYKLCYTLAIVLGLKPGDMKLVTALLFLGILGIESLKKGGNKKHVRA
ncbi:MAG: ABC transporter permease [Christensenellales bacterium]|jgi:putative ABC transport system permease protein